MDYRTLADELTAALQLKMPPVAVAFCDYLPAGLAPFDGAVPAGCAFWEKAAAGAFATSAQDHALCAIGVHTHNLPHTPVTESELKDAVQAMTGLDYVRPEEIAALPVARRQSR